MPHKKKRNKQNRQIQPAELIQLAENHLSCGRIDEAIQNLRLVEQKLQPHAIPGGKKSSIPPHLVNAQAVIQPLLARAFAARSLNTADPKRKLEDLKLAVKYAPEEIRYRIAIGACRLLMPQSDAACSDLEKAAEMRPGDAFATRAFTLGLLASGRALDAGELLKVWPENWRNEPWRRLTAIQLLSDIEAVQQSVNSSDGDGLLSGLWRLARGENDLAREDLIRLPVMDHNPSRVEAARIATQLFYSGWLSFNARRYQTAVASWREAGRLSQAHQLRLPWRDRLVAFYHKIAETVFEENLPLAIECWQEALKISSDDKTAQANLGAIKQAQAGAAWREGKIEQAVAVWNEVLKYDPQNERLIRNLAVGSERLARATEALRHWRALARVWRRQAKQRSEPGFKESLLKVEERVVNLMIETGVDGSEIVNELENTIRFDPDNLGLRWQIVEQLLEIGKPQAAIKHIDEMERRCEASSKLLTQKGMALDMLGRHKDARNIFEQAMALDPSDALTRRNYLIFLTQEADRARKRRDKKRAIEICERQLSIDQSYEPALALLASLYLGSKRKADAIELLKRLIANDPKSQQKLVIVGSIYLRHSMNKEAEAIFKEAISLDPDPLCPYYIGMSYLEIGLLRPSLMYFDLAAEAGDVDMLIEIAIGLSEAGSIKEIDRYLNKAIKIDPLNPMPYMIRGISRLNNPRDMLLRPNGLKNALKEIEEARRLAASQDKYKDLTRTLDEIKRHFENMPSDISVLLDEEPYLFDDDDDDPYTGRPRRSRKKRGGR